MKQPKDQSHVPLVILSIFLFFYIFFWFLDDFSFIAFDCDLGRISWKVLLLRHMSASLVWAPNKSITEHLEFLISCKFTLFLGSWNFAKLELKAWSVWVFSTASIYSWSHEAVVQISFESVKFGLRNVDKKSWCFVCSFTVVSAWRRNSCSITTCQTRGHRISHVAWSCARCRVGDIVYLM